MTIKDQKVELVAHVSPRRWLASSINDAEAVKRLITLAPVHRPTRHDARSVAAA
jgi:hypothetical protein